MTVAEFLHVVRSFSSEKPYWLPRMQSALLRIVILVVSTLCVLVARIKVMGAQLPVFTRSVGHGHRSLSNEEQIITGYPIGGAMGSLGGGQVAKLSVVCLHNNAIVARGILGTILHCGTPKPRLSTIYIVSSVGTSLFF